MPRQEKIDLSNLKITILYNTLQKPDSSNTSSVTGLDELKRWVLQGTIVKHFFRYKEAQLLTYHIDFIPKPFFIALLLKLLSRRESSVKDEQGRSQSITVRVLGKLLRKFLADFWEKSALLRRINREVEQLSGGYNERQSIKTLDLSSTPVYLRTDLWFGVPSGGSIGHIAGVLNNLDNYTGKPAFLTTDVIPTVRNDIETHYIYPRQKFWDFCELPGLFFNEIFENNAHQILQGRKLSFIYQRYSLNNYSGLKLARFYKVPFALEYNGSEIWINRHWGKPLKYESLSERIELLNLKSADLIVVVSDPMKDELVGRGIKPDKILVNPNGVDPEKYSPDIDGSSIQQKYNLKDKVVVGFIGTFGKWHGAEVLAEAFGRLIREFPKYHESLRLLMIGDGITMPQVKEKLGEYGVMDNCVLTGRIPQEEGPIHLAACDILVASHVPNPDGTPFFGSPTKLFEYMAMGKGIVASNLDQIGEVLEHGRTAWMVKPGDVADLAKGIIRLVEDKELRSELGRNAREEVVTKYTWTEHVRKIIGALEKVLNS